MELPGVRKLVPKLRALTQLSSDEAFPQLQSLCAEVGIIVVFVASVKKTGAQGATRWLQSDRAMIVLSDRYKMADVVWFAFFHEVGHVLSHPHRVTYVDNSAVPDDDNDGLESEANAFARRSIFGSATEDDLKKLKTPQDVKELAKRCGVGVSLVAGAYGHVTSDWKSFGHLRMAVSDELFV